ncbi:MAG: hypothetical protein NTY96_08935 [Bacteroidetes bacterium]|nr:hypothetical protein [Bacteroidota bacterium]
MSYTHKLYIFALSAIVLVTFALLCYYGYSYYRLPLEERFFHQGHTLLKPGGGWGHGFGIIGSLSMILGIVLYMVRKRSRFLGRFGLLKHWLEFHIFLCTLGPVLVLFHTSFKFGGLVAVSFWSMVAVFLSGVIGRFIYIQIPRTIEGRELSLNEVRDLKSNIGTILSESYKLDEESYNLILDSTKRKVELYEKNVFLKFTRKYFNERKTISSVKAAVKKNNLSRADRKEVVNLVKHDITLNRRIDRLVTMQNLFKYWHVAHLPFAIVMLIIMVIHVGVTIVLGYRWIF